MNSDLTSTETPPYTATLSTPDGFYKTTKVAMRVSEQLLKESSQQPYITKPCLFPSYADDVDYYHNFVFTACFGSVDDKERLVRITVCCEKPDGKLQFDIVVGRECTVENCTPKDRLPMRIVAARARGETIINAKRERVWVYTFNVHVNGSSNDKANSTIVTCETVQILPELTMEQKPKRPRGRPRGSRAASTSDSPTTSPKKIDTKPEKKGQKRARESEPNLAGDGGDTNNKQLMQASSVTETAATITTTATASTKSAHSKKDVAPPVDFSEVEQAYKKKFPDKTGDTAPQKNAFANALEASTRLQEIPI